MSRVSRDAIGFNWLSLLGRVKHANREVLDDFAERVIRIFDNHTKSGYTDASAFTNDVGDLLEELRRDL